MIFMDIGNERYKKTLIDYVIKFRYILILIFLVFSYMFVKDLVTRCEILVYNDQLEQMFTIKTNVGKTIKNAPDYFREPGYTIIWYDNPELDGIRVGFPYEVTGDAAFYPKLVGNPYTILFHPENGNQPFREIWRYKATIVPPEPPVWEGHVFEGWFEADADTPYQFTTMPLQGLYLYAHWTTDPEA